MHVDLTGVKLAEYLATKLTDLEFELLVRTRIKQEFDMVHAGAPNFEENHNECRFVMSWTDTSRWHVQLGSTYRDQVSLNGEVLHTTVQNAAHQYNMQHGNKLSLLLPAPTEQTAVEDDEIQF